METRSAGEGPHDQRAGAHGCGVIAKAQGGLGNVSARGLSKRGDHYVNSAYEESPVTIQLDIKGGIGEIKLIAAD